MKRGSADIQKLNLKGLIEQLPKFKRKIQIIKDALTKTATSLQQEKYDMLSKDRFPLLESRDDRVLKIVRKTLNRNCPILNLNMKTWNIN